MKKNKKEYETFSHAKTRLRYHIIFSTKYRHNCLNQIREDVYAACKYAESKSHFKILIMEIDKNHIHFLLKFKPAISIASVVRRLKQLSAKYLWDKQSSYLKQFYWKEKHIWTGGYFCSTIGEVSEQKIKHYIENQG